MKDAKQVRSKWLTIRLNEDEEKELNQLYSRTSSNGISEYARDVLLKEPVIVFFRNKTADEFLEEIVLLRKELNAIGNNFNQAVHKLHILAHIPEIKAWAILNEIGRQLFMKKVDEITKKMNEIHSLWLQK